MLKVNTRSKAVCRRGEEWRGDTARCLQCLLRAEGGGLLTLSSCSGSGRRMDAWGMNKYADGDRKDKIWETQSVSRLVSFIACIVSIPSIFSTIFHIFKAAAFSSPDCNTLFCFRCHRWKYNGGLVRKTIINPSISYLQENIWKVC